MDTEQTQTRIDKTQAHSGGKVLPLINFIFAIIVTIISIIITLEIFIFNVHMDRLFARSAIIPLIWAPYILRLFKLRLSQFVITFFNIYVLFAGLIGVSFAVFYNLPGYDKFIHFVFGYIGCVAGLLLACKILPYRQLNLVAACIFFLCVSLALGTVWEIGEFVNDCLGGTAQGIPFLNVITDTGAVVPKVTDVKDTMFDILCNTGGAIIFLIHFIISKLTKKNLLIKSMENDFLNNNKNFYDYKSNEKHIVDMQKEIELLSQNKNS